MLAATAAVMPGALTSVTPTGASSGVLVNLTGTGFSGTTSQNQVTFAPVGGGDPKTAVAQTSTTLDATRGVRRLSVRVPVGLAAGVVGVSVLNTATGEASNAATFDLVTIAVPQRASGAIGEQGVAVRITGSANAKFVAGSTRPAFGTGVTVVSTTVESSTSLVSIINIAANATPGPRSVSITSSTQSLLLPDGFQVTTAPPANAPPRANANGPYTANVNDAIGFSSAGSLDPDGDPLTYAWTFGDGGTSTEANPSHAYLTSGPFIVTLTVSDGKGGTNTATTSATVIQPNRAPQFTSSPLLTAAEGQPYSHQLTATDPDNDSLVFSLVAGPPTLTVSASGVVSWTPGATDAGDRAVQVQVSDGRGGVDTQAYSIAVAASVTLTGIGVRPASIRFTEVGASSPLTVTGTRSDQSTVDLTGSATGTTYESSNTGVATVSPDGAVTAIANGAAVITARNGGFADTSAITVEVGVILETLDLTPPVITLRALSATAATTLRGSFSDGSVRDLTSTPGTAFSIDAEAVATTTGNGVVTATGPGVATLTARHEGRTATAQVQVILAAGTAFLRGEVFDDSRGIPLAGASAAVVSGGAALLTPAQQIPADDRGRFVLPSGVGATYVRVQRDGFTTVDRDAEPIDNAVTTLLDARLTPLDGRVNLLQSVFGGQATSADGSAVLVVPPGSLDGDGVLRVTPLSNQGLQGVLPIGWSPIAAVDVQPAGRQFAQAATLRLPHLDTLAAGASVSLVRYDTANRRWVVQPPGQVSADRRSIAAPVSQTGQFAFVVADEAPFTPPPAVTGEPLIGLARPAMPDTSTATGEVIPRSAPPAEDVRAVGTVILQPSVPLPSGAVLRARVEEQFDLLDSTRVRPLPFVQDLVLYARPRLGNPGTLATRLPITPTLPFTIQQLSLGQVKLDLTIDEPLAQNAILGGSGGSITDDAGDTLEVPAGALLADVAIGLRSLAAGQLSIAIPEGFTSLGGVLIDLVGTTFTQPAFLSITRPSGLDVSRQIVVAQALTDISGSRRLKVVGLGAVTGTRIGLQTTLGPLTFEGVRTGGEYVFLQPQQPLGFVGGIVNSPAATPQALAQVSSTTAPFVFVTGATGTFVVAGRAGAATTVGALDTTGAAGSALTSLAAANDTAAVTLTLAVTAPAVVAVSPTANATNVALDASVVVDFSKPVDPGTVTATAVLLRAGQTVVATRVVVSANRRRITISPDAPLAGLTAYTLSLTSDIRDQSGNPLVPFAGSAFTTLDPSKPAALALGIITAELPGEDGLSLITGAPGAADAGAVVVATNLRTQETATVIALADGSFRVRIGVVLGDQIALTFRDANKRETTISITQFESPDGVTAIGEAGGSITGAGGRIARILPRALSRAGVFQLKPPTGTALPLLPGSVSIVDRFSLAVEGASFRQLDALTLTESQGRFAAGTAFTSPFIATGQLTVPADFLVSASLRFTASVVDRDGTRRTASGATAVLAGNPDASPVETTFSEAFPTVFLTVPRQAFPAQAFTVTAVAPTARVEFELPSAAPPQGVFVLSRAELISGEPKLLTVDRLALVEGAGPARLRTAGREFPGTSTQGEYVAVAGPLSFVTGRVNGPAAIVEIDGWPFVAQTEIANGAFVIAVPADAPFTLRFSDRASGVALGTATGQAPAAGGSFDVGAPLAAPGQTLTVTADPDARTVVDIATPLAFAFSEPLDPATVTSAAFVITDESGARTFGSAALSSDRQTVTFVPSRRWRFSTRYHYRIATTVTGASGARLQQPFGGEFTTFAPRILGSSAVGLARDVAVSGGLGVVATDSGLTVLDLARPSAPAVTASVALPSGARGVAFVTAPLTSRTGQTVTGPVAAVASGDATTKGLLQTYSLTPGGAPVLIGSTQLTAAPGEPVPVGVPAVFGIPNAVAVGAQNRASVSVRSAGVTAVDLGTAIPPDAGQPAAGVAARFPPNGVADVVQTAIVSDRIVAATGGGLVVLNATTFEQVAAVPSAGALTAVAGAEGLRIDVNGDGAIADAETFDVAVVGDAAGVIQTYRLGDGTPELLSVVRMPAGASIGGIAISREELLAYVGAGARGLAMVDLAAPPSVQPVDLNVEGLDDRVLGLLTVPGAAGRIAPQLERGVVMLAAGTGGVHTVQMIPARTRFRSVHRDPILGHSGDEESIGEGGTVFTTDRALVLDVDALVPDTERLTLAIEEEGAGPRTLTFSGLTVTAIVPGSNVLTAAIAPAGPGGTVAFVVRNAAGAAVARRSLRLSPPPAAPVLVGLLAVPAPTVLDAATPIVALAVGGQTSDGRVLNVTAPQYGSVYRSQDVAVAVVDQDGVVSAVGGGRTVIDVRNQALTASVSVQVQRPATLVSLDAPRSRTTLFTAEPTALDVVAIYSDGSRRPAAEAPGVVIAAADTAVVTIAPDGRVTAVGDGVTTVTASAGALSATVEVAVELRGAASISSIDLAPFAGAVTTDAGSAVAVANIAGTGSLHGFPVTFSTPAGVTARVLTDAGGRASAFLTGLATPGTHTVTAMVTDVATGQARSDEEALVVVASSRDAEPNNTASAASLLAVDRTVAGTLGAADAQDVFRIAADTAGSLQLTLDLGAGTAPTDLVVVVRDADGRELSRISPTSSSATVSVNVPAGGAFVSIELVGQGATYTLRAALTQAPLSIASVVPTTGPPGTAVAIVGSGFSARLEANAVFFAGVRGKLVGASPTRLDVIVPVNAIDGPLSIMSGAVSVEGPRFVVGNAGPPPAGFSLPDNPAKQRFDPLSGSAVDVSRLWVEFDVTVTRAQVDALLAPFGATVAGFNPSLNQYLVERAVNATLADLRVLKASLAALPQVTFVSQVFESQTQADRTIDMRDRSGTWPNDRARSAAYELSSLFDAIDAVRRSRDFRDANKFRKVKIAIIDSGFSPTVAANFPYPVAVRRLNNAGVLVTAPGPDRGYGHGTAVAGLIAAANNGDDVSGVLASLYQRDELAIATAKMELVVYACGKGDLGIDNGCIDQALIEIKNGGFDVVNMSLRAKDYAPALAPPWCPGAGTVYAGAEHLCWYYGRMQPLLDKTLVVVAAGNDGIIASNTFPAVLSRALPNVVTVGAVASVDLDTSGERYDHRSRFFTATRAGAVVGEVDCRGGTPTPIDASNCGFGVTLAAPGEDFYTTGTSPGIVQGIATNLATRYFNGTSSAAPFVAGVAAILRSIRPTEASLTPAEVRRILVDSADDISATWQPAVDTMKRVNVLRAVRAVLPQVFDQRLFVADHTDGAPAGVLVALTVDPAGEATGVASLVPLQVTTNGATLSGQRPTSVLTAPGDRAFVLASLAGGGGDAVFVINTITLEVESAIPLSRETSLKSTMVATRNGRILFVANGTHVTVVDTSKREVVTNLDQLLWSSRVVRPIPFAPIAEPFSAILQALDGEITSLALSPDDRSLYATVRTGGGSGLQEGLLLEIDVQLDVDRDLATPEIELNVDRFFKLKHASTTFRGRDEPSAVAASPDGQHVYMANGGVEAFTSITPLSNSVPAQLSAFAANMVPSVLVTTTIEDLGKREGYTQLLTAGRTQAFSVVNGQLDKEVFSFTSELSTAWTPDRPVISDQFVRRSVNSERPFGLAFRPMGPLSQADGTRALISFFQTGNFGVVDLGAQNAQSASAPAGVFKGLVAVTPSVPLDHSLWPIESADQARLFAGPITYAQHGRFAAAVHTGNRGGAVTIIDDKRISDDLIAHMGGFLPNPNGSGTVPFFSIRSLCATRAAADAIGCDTDVFKTITEYGVGGAATPFSRPRGVAIHPFVSIVGIGNGDVVHSSRGIVFAWRDTQAVEVEVSAFDLGVAGGTLGTLEGIESRVLSPAENTAQTGAVPFANLFVGSAPVDNHRYRVEVRLIGSDGKTIGFDSVEVVFRQ